MRLRFLIFQSRLTPVKKILDFEASGSNAVVEQLSLDPKFEGSNTADADTGREKKNNGEIS